MKIGVVDIESNGLLDEATVIWCATVKELNGPVRVFRPHEIQDLPAYLETFDILIGHNLIGFDKPLLKKILGYEFKKGVKDTLLYSRILFPDMDYESYEEEYEERELVDEYYTEDDEHIREYELVKKVRYKKAKSRHGLENWGIKLGIAKPQYDKWDEFTEEMLHRNMEDVKITEALYNYIQEYTKELQMKDKRLQNWDAIFNMEIKFWEYMIEAENRGWLIDTNLLFDLETDFKKQLDSIDSELVHSLPIRIIQPYDKPCQAFKKDGSITANALNWVGVDKEKQIGGDFSRVVFEQTNAGSHEQIKEFLLANGWKPAEYNYKKDRFKKAVKDENNKVILTSPKKPKTEEDWDLIAQNMDMPAIRLLAKRSKIVHRLGLVQGFISKLRTDKRLSGSMITVGCVTQRCAHKVIANIPNPEPDVFYGKEMRSLFICPDDKVIVGIDTSGLEARCEAHYLYPFDKAAALELIEGDIHQKNAEAWDVSRKLAKNGKYALAYGCAPPKLAATLGKPLGLAKELYDAYWIANPAAKNLKDALERQWEKHGYIVGIDGRPLMVRYKHTLLNTLLQSAGAILMKIALCFAMKGINRQALEASILIHYHDEFELECNPVDAELVSLISQDAIVKAGEYLKMNVPFIGCAKVGRSWFEVH